MEQYPPDERQYESSWRCTYHSTTPIQTWADFHKAWQEVLHSPPHHPHTPAAACYQLMPVDSTTDLQREETPTEAEECTVGSVKPLFYISFLTQTSLYNIVLYYLQHMHIYDTFKLLSPETPPYPTKFTLIIWKRINRTFFKLCLDFRRQKIKIKTYIFVRTWAFADTNIMSELLKYNDDQLKYILDMYWDKVCYILFFSWYFSYGHYMQHCIKWLLISNKTLHHKHSFA